MRIAVSGSHATGKTTLAQAFAERFPRFQFVDEAYVLLADEGVTFADPPSYDDFDAMLARAALALQRGRAADCVFDRCPADYLAYLAATTDRADSDRVEEVRAAVRDLDLIVFVPIEQHDRIAPAMITRPRLRRRVDQLLRAMLVDDSWGLGGSALEVTGTVPQRLDHIRRHVKDRIGVDLDASD